MRGRVLIIAGSDSGGGAGIQADIKAVTALNGFAMTALTALTAQNTEGVHEIVDLPESFLARQIQVVLDDLGADAVKIGMLHRPAVIDTVAELLADRAARIPIVLDPVMVAKGGAKLLTDESVETVRARMLPLAHVLTPNIPEAEALTGIEIADDEAALRAGRALLAMGPKAVLLKGGHLEGDQVVDRIFVEDSVVELVGPRIQTRHTHGTGCTLSSAIAAGLAQEMTLKDSILRARDYVFRAIETAPGFGRGHGPLNHAHTVRPDWWPPKDD